MEIQSDGTSDMAAVKEVRQQLASRIDTAQLDLIASLQTVVPDLVSSLDVSLMVVSSFNHRPSKDSSYRSSSSTENPEGGGR